MWCVVISGFNTNLDLKYQDKFFLLLCAWKRDKGRRIEGRDNKTNCTAGQFNQFPTSILNTEASPTANASLFSHLTQPHHSVGETKYLSSQSKKKQTKNPCEICFLFNSKPPVNSDVNFLIDVWLIKHHPGFLVVCFFVFVSSRHSGITASVGSIEPAAAHVALPGYQVSYVPLRKSREHIF